MGLEAVTTFSLISWGVTSAVAVIAAGSFYATLQAAQRHRYRGAWLISAGLSTGLAAFLTLPAAFISTLIIDHIFGAIHVLFAALAMVPALLAIVGWTTLGGTRGGTRSAAVVLCGLASIAPMVVAYAGLIEPRWLVTERAQVVAAGMPPSAEPIRIVVLADFQTDRVGPHEQAAIDRALAEEPDLILMPGDLFDCWPETFARNREEFVRVLSQLRAPYGVWASQGNIDRLERVGPVLSEAGIRLMLDEVELINIRGTQVAVGGAAWHETRTQRQPMLDEGVFEEAELAAGVAADVRIMIAHAPDAILGTRSEDQIDLIVSGHTHGGQVQIPGFGPPITFSKAPRSICAGGLHQTEATQIYVSRGVGRERRYAPPLRFHCRPEVSVLELVPASAPLSGR